MLEVLITEPPVHAAETSDQVETLFRVFMRPILHPINAADGITSIKRAYTPRELRSMVEEAVRGTNARFVHIVAPFYIRQIIDLEFEVN